MVKVVSYYTANTKYEEYVEPFQNNLREFSLDSKIYTVRNRGRWELNCALKPHILYWAREDFPEEDLLFLDIDAVVKRHLLKKDLKPDMPGICRVFNRVASGTIWLPACPSTDRLILIWRGLQEIKETVWDQIILQEVLNKRTVPYYWLPETWIAIHRTYKVKDPIIYHTQASRTLKHEINETGSHSKTA